MEKFLINLKTNKKIVEERKRKAEDSQFQEKTDDSTEKNKKKLVRRISIWLARSIFH